MTPKEIADSLPPKERAAYILSLQSPSTVATLTRPVEDDIAWFKREIPKSAQVRDEDGNIFVGHRAISFEEEKLHKRLRYERGQHLAEMRGEPDASSATPEKKSAAIQAFMFVKTKFKDLMKLCGLASEKEYAEFKREK